MDAEAGVSSIRREKVNSVHISPSIRIANQSRTLLIEFLNCRFDTGTPATLWKAD